MTRDGRVFGCAQALMWFILGAAVAAAFQAALRSLSKPPRPYVAPNVKVGTR